MANEFIQPEGLTTPRGFTPVVRAGNTVYISGQVSRDRDGNFVGVGDIAAQARQVHQNLKAAIEGAGGTLNDIVKLTTYMTSLDYRTAVAEERQKYWQTNPPASTLLVISSLAMPEYLLEVEAIAVLQDK